MRIGQHTKYALAIVHVAHCRKGTLRFRRENQGNGVRLARTQEEPPLDGECSLGVQQPPAPSAWFSDVLPVRL